MKCSRKDENLSECNCHYNFEDCPRKGICCECILYHRELRQLPACYFDMEAELKGDRSIENFVKLNSKEYFQDNKNKQKVKKIK